MALRNPPPEEGYVTHVLLEFSGGPYKSVYGIKYDKVGIEDVQLYTLSEDGLLQTATVGYFLGHFATVELCVDLLLRRACGVEDLGAYKILTRRLLPRNKVERLRDALRGKTTLGGNLDSRLRYFAERMCSIRNTLAHSAIVHEKPSDWLEFLSLEEFPRLAAQKKKAAIRTKIRMRVFELFEHAQWLRLFTQDLTEIGSRVRKTFPKVLEVNSPRSALPLVQASKRIAATSRARKTTNASDRKTKPRA